MSDDIKHTLDFLGGKGEIVAFDVPSSYRDEIRRTAVPQQNPGDFTPGEWKEMKRICPEISDPTRGMTSTEYRLACWMGSEEQSFQGLAE